MNSDYYIPTKQGWQCPVCGRVMSPTMMFCPCEGRGVSEISTWSNQTKGDTDWALKLRNKEQED